MAWENFKCEIKGVSPLIMHNGNLADPRNQYAKMMKERTGKRNKTESDLQEIERIEFLGGLYWKENQIILPAHVIEATIIAASKKHREGMLAKSGFFCINDSLLKYHGPQVPQKLWENEHFHYRQMVVVSKSRISRMRPIFNEWGAELFLQYETTVINVSRLKAWVETAGKFIGFCELRPKYGRFEVV